VTHTDWVGHSHVVPVNQATQNNSLFDESLIAHMFCVHACLLVSKNCKENSYPRHFFNIAKKQRLEPHFPPYRCRHDKQAMQLPQAQPITQATLATTTDRTFKGREVRWNRKNDV
jgi:hypothetical protein